MYFRRLHFAFAIPSGRSLAEIVASNLAGGVDVYLL
jgi:hypothetical protein